MLDWAMASGLWVSPSSSLRIIFLADDIQCRCDFKSNYAVVPVVPNCFSQLFLQVRLKMKLSVSIYAMIAGLLLGCIAQQSSQGQTPQESAVAQTLDVSFIPSDFCAAVVVHPARIAKSGVADQLPIDDLAQKFVGLAGFDLRDVQQLVVFVDPMPGGNVIFFPAGVVRFSKDIDVQEILSPKCKDLKQVSFGKKSYWSTTTGAMGGVPLCIHAVDGRTVVVGPEVTLQQMLTVGKVESPLTNRLKKVDLDNDLVLVFSFEPVRTMFSQIFGDANSDKFPPPVKPLLSIPQDAKFLTLELNLSNDSLLTLAAEPNEDAQAAARLEAAANHVHGLVKDIHAGAAPQLKEKFPPAADLAKQLVDGVGVAKENGQVVIRIKRPDDLLETVKKMAPAVEALIGSNEASPEPSR